MITLFFIILSLSLNIISFYHLESSSESHMITTHYINIYPNDIHHVVFGHQQTVRVHFLTSILGLSYTIRTTSIDVLHLILIYCDQLAFLQYLGGLCLLRKTLNNT